MLRLIKILGMCAVLFSSIDRASALSFTADATSEQYQYTNESAFSVSLSSVLLFIGATQVSSPSFSAVTLATGQTFAETISNLSVGTTYTTVPITVSEFTPTKFAEAVGAVPLPAGFPLFAMALLALGSVAYFGTRNRSTDKTSLGAA
jgi:hypothetical protein